MNFDRRNVVGQKSNNANSLYAPTLGCYGWVSEIKMTDAVKNMKQVQLKGVQENFEQIFEDVLVSVGPVKSLKDTGNAILVSEEVWRGTRETLNLVSIPGMRVSIRSGMCEPVTDTKKVCFGKSKVLETNTLMEEDFLEGAGV
jgi:hypothetical protein